MSQPIPSTRLVRVFEDHEGGVKAVAVFPDKRRMVTALYDKTLRLWDLKTSAVLKKTKRHRIGVSTLAVSRDGQIIASGDYGGEIIAWHGETLESLTQPIKAQSLQITSLDFAPDGTVLATDSDDYTVKLWCTKTWQIQGEPIECGGVVRCIRHSPSGELLAIATNTNIQIYNPGTRERIASFKAHRSYNLSLAWTPDGTRLLSAGNSSDPTIREWDSLSWQQVSHPWEGHTSSINAIAIHPAGTLVASTSDDNHICLWRLSDRRIIAIFQHSSRPKCVTFSLDGKHILSGGDDKKISEWGVPSDVNSKILEITTARKACIAGDLDTAEELLTQEIDTDANPHTYAHRSFVMARKHDWDHALQDANMSISIRPSLTGFISKGIALCGKGHVREARTVFDVASMFTNQDSDTNHFLLLIKAIALFSADQYDEAMLLVKELAAACPNTDPLARHVVETYLRIQLGTKASDDARHDEATDHFTAVVNASALSSKFIHLTYEDLTVLFNWDLESLLLTTHQKRYQAFLLAGKPVEALEAHQCMMDAIDDTTKASCLDWSNEFKEQCSTLAAHDDRILGMEIPRQDRDGYDAEPNFFQGMHQNSQIVRSRPRQRPGRLQRLRLAMTRSPHSAPPPVPPTTPPPVAATITFRTHLQHLFTRPPHHATPPVVEVPFAKGKERNAAADAPDKDSNIVPYEDQDLVATQPDPNTQQQQQQQQPVAVHVDPGEHGGGKSCVCC